MEFDFQSLWKMARLSLIQEQGAVITLLITKLYITADIYQKYTRTVITVIYLVYRVKPG